MPAFIDLTKEKFGRLTVIERAENNKWGRVCWSCRCECGRLKVVSSNSLRLGATKSCGCLQPEIIKQIKTKHGMCGTRIYEIWKAMLQRCNNSKNINYKDYGGRGITVCDKWLNFKGFFEDMGYVPNNLTLERKNNSIGYFKENCCFVTRTTQARNRRVRKNNKVGVSGIYWNKSVKKYIATIGVTAGRLYLGVFANLEQAVEARKLAEQKHWGC